MTLDKRFADAMGGLLGPSFPSDVALAVSGGGDSMAMLLLAHNWTRAWGVRLHVVTVDHGLRPESAAEAQMVAEECALLGHPHTILRWRWDGTGNKLDAARRARLRLIDAWRGQIAHVLLAHTRDDLAETFLMRLARGAGLDGLSAMQPLRALASGMTLVRPCLGMARAELRHYATVLKSPFVDDPSNDDPAYVRARMRALLPLLQTHGFARETLAETAEHLRAERAALNARAADIWNRFGAQDGPVLSLHPDWAAQTEVATQRRLLNAALRYVAGAEYGPRAAPLDALVSRVTSGGAGTLHGCDLQFVNGRLTIFREYASVAQMCGTVDDTSETANWDTSWTVKAPDLKGFTLRALGQDGWDQLPREHREGLRHRVALAWPSVWQGDHLTACAGLTDAENHGISFRHRGQGEISFARFLLSH
nr:tRNA lysidine(34) synthetase TilS [Tropicibacter naphthalenivorans]